MYKIALLPGDGIGPEVIDEGVKVVSEAARCCHIDIKWECFDWGCGYWKKHGEAMPPDGLDILKGFDAIYLGAMGLPGVPEPVPAHGFNLKIRKGFDQYINLRPVKVFHPDLCPIKGKEDKDIDFVVVRENTEGEYAGVGGRLYVGTPNEVAVQTSVFTRMGTERVMRFSFELARKRNGKKRVTCCTKSNACNYSMTFWEEVFDQVAAEYPDIQTNKTHVDALTTLFIIKPEFYDVVVASNLFGDIISDEAAAVVGSLGMAPGANLDPTRRYPSMFEPIHGSAPDIAGKGIANPIGTVWAGALMMEHLGEQKAADLIMKAVETVCRERKVRTPDLGGKNTTAEMGNALRDMVAEFGRGCCCCR